MNTKPSRYGVKARTPEYQHQYYKDHAAERSNYNRAYYLKHLEQRRAYYRAQYRIEKKLAIHIARSPQTLHPRNPRPPEPRA